MDTAFDNDVLIKGACYWLLPDILVAAQSTIETSGVLGAAKYVCQKALMRRGSEEAWVALSDFISKFNQFEPTEAEASLAAEIELEAQRRGLELDAGESLLLAIVDARNISSLSTGDKRAILAIEQILIHQQGKGYWKKRILCFEQIIRRIIKNRDPVAVRDQICAARQADKALSICFGCSGGTGDAASWISGLDSYIADIRNKAPTVLTAD